MDTPEWMTTDFFQSCLQSEKGQSVTVLRFTIGPPVVPEGNNYGSQLFQVVVDYKEGGISSSISLIIKGSLANLEVFSNELDQKEIKFYKEFVKAADKIICLHDIVPKYYNSPNTHCVVLEDLRSSGYVMVDRHNFLDLEHCQLFIKAKAKLHALSVAIYRQNPELIKSLVEESPTYTENIDKMNKTMIGGSLRCMAAYLEDKPDYQYYLDIIEKLNKNENLYKMFQKIENSSSKKPLKVLVQLDPWCTNMMFKYNSINKVDKIKLLDFQALAFTSPLREIVAFTTFCPNMEVRQTKLGDLYHLYCETLNENLSNLKCPERLNLEEMKAEIVDMSPIVLFYVIACIPFSLSEGKVDMNEFLTGNILKGSIKDNTVYKLYQNDSFNRYYPQLLDVINKEGVFDFVKKKLEEEEIQ